MTPDALDRSMPAWLAEQGSGHVPRHLDEVLAITARTRQRPWWSSPGRWLPMDLTLRPVAPGWRVRPVLVLLLVALLIAAIAILGVGSNPTRLPAPFGLAANGLWNTSVDGELYRLDPSTGALTALVTDPAYDFGGTFSRDGTKFMFLRAAAEPGPGLVLLQLGVADADGRNVRLLTEPTRGMDWMDWSPDGSQIAYIAEVDGVEGILHVVDVKTGISRRLTTARPVHFPGWLPPGGNEIVYTTRRAGDGDPMPAVYAIRPDGTGERRLSRRIGTSEFDFQDLAVSPDGHTVGFTHWDVGYMPSVRFLDVTTHEERTLPEDGGIGQRDVVFSPDGTRVAYHRLFVDYSLRLVVAPADGSDAGVELGPAEPGVDGWYPNVSAAFTPDGSALVANYGRDEGGVMMLLPLDGSTPTTLAEGKFGFTDVQRRAP